MQETFELRLRLQCIIDRLLHPETGAEYARELEKLNIKYKGHPKHKLKLNQAA